MSEVPLLLQGDCLASNDAPTDVDDDPAVRPASDPIGKELPLVGPFLSTPPGCSKSLRGA